MTAAATIADMKLYPEIQRYGAADVSACFSCGTCTQCDNCFHYCPDLAIRRVAAGGYEVLTDYCKGCGMCVSECPCGAIKMVPEDI